ncbi:MAG: ATP-binding cassette domain-containing protein [Desulfobacterota bacterium]|nr:ATP-binding cassette domain-containing protein [Thermodesulfobacteriota bacterium]
MRLSARIKSFRYPDGTVALSDLDLDIREGEVIGLLGANGSGKTTLLKVLDGLLKDFEGEVLLDGQEVRRLPSREIYRKMGLVFQDPDDQLFGATVFEDAAFGPINMGWSEEKIASHVKEALRSVDLADYAGKPIHHLSYGQKKRACLAGLLAMDHEILLLDEPTDGLDPMGEHEMIHLLMRLNQEKKITMVIATHRVDLVPLFVDRLYILNQGRIVKEGRPEEVFTAPAEMERFDLRLPLIAELIYRLKNEDRLPFDRIPLTIGEARREILKLVGSGSA